MLDKIDHKILEELQRDGRMTNTDLAERVNLSATPCLKRVKKLEKAGVIKGYKAVIDQEKLGYNMTGIILMKIGDTSREAVDAFGEAVKKIPAITECHMTTGRIDYFARVFAKDFRHYETIIKDDVGRLPNIVSMETLFLFSNVVSDDNFRVPHWTKKSSAL